MIVTNRVRVQLVVLVLVGLVQVVSGVLQVFFDPRVFSTPVGIHLEGPSALSAVRGVEGGIHLFVGAFVIVAAAVERLREGGLWVALACCGGVVFGRLVSLALDGSPNRTTWGYFALEAVGTAAVTVALRLRARA